MYMHNMYGVYRKIKSEQIHLIFKHGTKEVLLNG